MSNWDDTPDDFVSAPVSNQWSGEDEDNVAESWDAEAPAKPAVIAPKPKKTKEEKIAEREAKRRQELEDREKRAAEEAAANSMTELQRQQISRKAELDLLGNTFGDQGEKGRAGTLESLHPTTKEEFGQLSQFLQEKILSLDKSPHYVVFLEGLIRGVIANVDVDSLRKLSGVINTYSNEKQKNEKHKPKAKKTVKANIKVTKAVDAMADLGGDAAVGEEYYHSEEEDFM